MAQFVGTYKYDSDDGKFDELLKAMDVPFVTRKIASKLSPTIEISVDGEGCFTVKTSTTFKNSEIKFKIDEEFQEQRMDGVTVRTIITLDGNKLIQKQYSDPEVEIVREFNGNLLKTVAKCKDVVCVRNYKKA